MTAIPTIIAAMDKTLVSLSFDLIASMRKIQPRLAPAMLTVGINAIMSAIIDPHKGRFLDFGTEVEFTDYSLPNVKLVFIETFHGPAINWTSSLGIFFFCIWSMGLDHFSQMRRWNVQPGKVNRHEVCLRKSRMNRMRAHSL